MFSQDIVLSAGDWRPGLAHMARQGPEYFFPDEASNFHRFEGAKPEIHRVDPVSGSALRRLWGFSVKVLGQLANFGSTL
jgi:hypothetical protein